jgi:hypothetical protein
MAAVPLARRLVDNPGLTGAPAAHGPQPLQMLACLNLELPSVHIDLALKIRGSSADTEE